MKENLSMFAYTQMVVFFALSAAFYAVILWVFAALPLWIIPGVTGLRPGNAIPIVASLLWGPAASWGTAVGNLIGFDILGGALTIGSIGGFVGNWIYGLLPYYTWHKMFKEEPDCKSFASLLRFEATALLNSSACAMVISLWTEAIGFVPFGFLSVIITLNNFIAEATLGVILMVLFYDRVKKLGWLWTDVMPEYSLTCESPSKRTVLGYLLVWIGFVIGNFITIGVAVGLTGAFLEFAFVGTPVVATGLFFVIVGIIGLAMMEYGGQWRKMGE